MEMSDYTKEKRRFTKQVWYRWLPGALLIIISYSASGAEIQSLDSIHSAIIRFVKNDIDSSARAEITVGLTDHRLRLQRCSVPLEIVWTQGARRVGNTSVEVRCTGNKPWTIYAPVRIRLFRPVMVAAATLTRGQVLGTADYTMEEKDIGSLLTGYIDSAKEYSNHQVKRPIRIGQVITPYMLQVPKLVRRGEQVVLLAETGGLQVHSAGVALEDGGRGETVKIRNSSSSRVVEGRVVSPGVVRIAL